MVTAEMIKAAKGSLDRNGECIPEPALADAIAAALNASRQPGTPVTVYVAASPEPRTPWEIVDILGWAATILFGVSAFLITAECYFAIAEQFSPTVAGGYLIMVFGLGAFVPWLLWPCGK